MVDLQNELQVQAQRAQQARAQQEQLFKEQMQDKVLMDKVMSGLPMAKDKVLNYRSWAQDVLRMSTEEIVAEYKKIVEKKSGLSSKSRAYCTQLMMLIGEIRRIALAQEQRLKDEASELENPPASSDIVREAGQVVDAELDETNKDVK